MDKSGRSITDPLRADLEDYQFVGFFAVPKNGLDVGEGQRYNVSGNANLSPEQRRARDWEGDESLRANAGMAPPACVPPGVKRPEEKRGK